MKNSLIKLKQMENLCRLCLKMSTQLENLWNIHNGMQIASLVTSICLIKLDRSDNKPNVSLSV